MHLKMMDDSRWLKKIYNWDPKGSKRLSRPSRTRNQEEKEKMEGRDLQEKDWWDRDIQ